MARRLSTIARRSGCLPGGAEDRDKVDLLCASGRVPGRRQPQQRFHQRATAVHRPPHLDQRLAELGRRGPRVGEHDLGLGAGKRERGAKLVGCVGDEAPLGREGSLETGEHRVKAPASSWSSSRGPSRARRASRVSGETSRAESVIRRSGASSRPARSQPAAPATAASAASAARNHHRTRARSSACSDLCAAWTAPSGTDRPASVLTRTVGPASASRPPSPPASEVPLARTAGATTSSIHWRRLRNALAELRIHRSDGDGEIGVTASFGVAGSARGASESSALLRAADAALYRAEVSGKNRVASTDA
ncbi:MAG TPA: hypothetical protein VGC32_13590 [Solirubrobacterales bacterium]